MLYGLSISKLVLSNSTFTFYSGLELILSVTGTCECTGVLGPMLGGGHGILQGRYGLLADNLISARMVLANGTAITISSDSNPDLFWAVRGAGHNFGIVTEFTYKIYDVGKNANWAYESFIFTNDKLEELYEQLNILTNNGTQPVELWNFSYFISLPVYDPDNVGCLPDVLINH